MSKNDPRQVPKPAYALALAKVALEKIIAITDPEKDFLALNIMEIRTIAKHSLKTIESLT